MKRGLSAFLRHPARSSDLF